MRWPSWSADDARRHATDAIDTAARLQDLPVLKVSRFLLAGQLIDQGACDVGQPASRHSSTTSSWRMKRSRRHLAD